MTHVSYPNLTGGLLARKGEARPATGMIVRSSIACSQPVRSTREVGFAASYTVAAKPAASRPGMNAGQAAAYVGVSRATFLSLVRQGLFSDPQHFGWDLQTLDATFDRLSGFARPARAS